MEKIVTGVAILLESVLRASIHFQIHLDITTRVDYSDAMKKAKKIQPRGQPMYFVAWVPKGSDRSGHYCLEHQVQLEISPGRWSSKLEPISFTEAKARKEVEKLQAKGLLACAWHAGWENRGFQQGEQECGYLCGDDGVCYGIHPPKENLTTNVGCETLKA